MPTYGDWVKETANAPGTGTFTLLGAAAGFQAFSAAYPNATTKVPYSASDGTNWETGYGTYTLSGTTLSRDVVVSSSNSGSLVNFTGTVNVFVAQLGESIADMGVTVAIVSKTFPSGH